MAGSSSKMSSSAPTADWESENFTCTLADAVRLGNRVNVPTNSLAHKTNNHMAPCNFASRARALCLLPSNLHHFTNATEHGHRYHIVSFATLSALPGYTQAHIQYSTLLHLVHTTHKSISTWTIPTFSTASIQPQRQKENVLLPLSPLGLR